MATSCWAEHVEGVARKAGRLDVALVHGAGDGGTGDQVGAVLWEKNAFADGVDGVAGAADALHAAGDRRRRLDLDDEIDRTHVDAEFEGGGGAEGLDLAGLELLLDDGALGRRRGSHGGRGQMGSPARSLSAPASRSATWRLLTKRIVEFRSRISSSKRGWIAFQMETRRGICEAGPLGISSMALQARHIFNWNFNTKL